MSNSDHFDGRPTKRFSGLAAVYARARPTYPTEAIDEIVRRGNLSANSLLVDIGAGTGISARLFAARGIHVIGVEPNDDMRQQAESNPSQGQINSPTYKAGKAEETGLADGDADAVLCAQSFHWFEPESTLKEFHRILKPNGLVALIWNERDEADPFTSTYGQVIRSLKDAAPVESPRSGSHRSLMESKLFTQQEKVTFKNSQVLDEIGLVDRSFSASYAPRTPEEAAPFEQRIREVFHQFADASERVELRYETSIYFAVKA